LENKHKSKNPIRKEIIWKTIQYLLDMDLILKNLRQRYIGTVVTSDARHYKVSEINYSDDGSVGLVGLRTEAPAQLVWKDMQKDIIEQYGVPFAFLILRRPNDVLAEGRQEKIIDNIRKNFVGRPCKWTDQMRLNYVIYGVAGVGDSCNIFLKKDGYGQQDVPLVSELRKDIQTLYGFDWVGVNILTDDEIKEIEPVGLELWYKQKYLLGEAEDLVIKNLNQNYLGQIVYTNMGTHRCLKIADIFRDLTKVVLRLEAIDDKVSKETPLISQVCQDIETYYQVKVRCSVIDQPHTLVRETIMESEEKIIEHVRKRYVGRECRSRLGWYVIEDANMIRLQNWTHIRLTVRHMGYNEKPDLPVLRDVCDENETLYGHGCETKVLDRLDESDKYEKYEKIERYVKEMYVGKTISGEHFSYVYEVTDVLVRGINTTPDLCMFLKLSEAGPYELDATEVRDDVKTYFNMPLEFNVLPLREEVIVNEGVNRKLLMSKLKKNYKKLYTVGNVTFPMKVQWWKGGTVNEIWFQFQMGTDDYIRNYEALRKWEQELKAEVRQYFGVYVTISRTTKGLPEHLQEDTQEVISEKQFPSGRYDWASSGMRPHEEDAAKVEQMRQQLEGRVVTISKTIRLDSKNARPYTLQNFSFRIGKVSGSNGTRISQNTFLVNKADLQGKWQIIRFYIGSVEILDGDLRVNNKKLTTFNSDDKATSGLISIIYNLLLRLISDEIVALGIPKEQLTLDLRGLRFAPEFLERNNSVRKDITAYLNRKFRGVVLRYETYAKQLYFYTIKDIRPVHGQSYKVVTSVSQTPPPEASEWPGGIAAFKQTLHDYLGITKVEITVGK
jgi:hypothetical protein